MTGKKFTAIAIALVFILAIGATGAWAAEDFMRNTQGYGVGAWYASMYGQVTSGTQSFSLRQDLGITDSFASNVDINWQFDDRWGLDVNHVWAKGSTSRFTTPSGFVFEGNNVAAGDILNSSVKLNMLSLLIRYSLVRNEDGQFDIGISPRLLKAEASVYDVTTGTSILNEDKTVFFALPALSGKQRISERIYFDGNAQALSLEGNRMVDLRADLRWNFQHPGWFATLGYRYVDARVELTGNRVGTIHWNGPVLTVRKEF